MLSIGIKALLGLKLQFIKCEIACQRNNGGVTLEISEIRGRMFLVVVCAFLRQDF